MQKISWDDIPSLDNLEVDWEYTPENTLGKRTHVRISNKDLHRFFSEEQILVRIVSSSLNYTGHLLDISQNGLAVSVKRDLQKGLPVKVGFFIGKHKLVSKGIVRNSIVSENSYRVGIEFIDLQEEDASFIVKLNTSRLYARNVE